MLSLVLYLPIVALYVVHYALAAHGGWIGTGFLQGDGPVYMANARKFFDDGFHLFYSNPCSSSLNPEYIYFQPHFFVMGLAEKLTGISPGTVYVAFGVVTGVACIRVAIALYEGVAGLSGTAQRLGLLVFMWGGGVLALAGIALALAHHETLRDTMKDMFVLDPGNGWWFMNLGRNLVYPVESYYHLVAFGAMVMLLRKRYLIAAALGFLISISHPFTGLQFLLIMVSWAWLECWFIKSDVVPTWFFVAVIGLLVTHFAYYVGFLNLFTEQRALYDQLTYPSIIRAGSFIPADLIVGTLAFVALRNLPLAREMFSHPSNRMFLVWFIVSFALAHHDFAVQPRQPAHFTRGYTYVPLFLLGVGPMLNLWNFLLGIQVLVFRIAAIGAVMLFFLSDNILWFASRTVGRYVAAASEEARSTIPDDLYDGVLTDKQDLAFYAWLNQQPEHSELLVVKDPAMPYLALAYTPFRAWYTHPFNTPYADQRRQEVADYYSSGKIPPGWIGRKLFIVLPNDATSPLPEVYRNDRYHVVLLDLTAAKS